MTTNPTIFAAAVAQRQGYAEAVAELAAQGADAETAALALTTRDVQDACDELAGVHAATDGVDGRVSIEVDPRLAHDAAATVAQARQLWHQIARENLLVKIPATAAGLPAITGALAEGISVNVTLIFSLERYRAVMNAFLDGLEHARTAGVDLAGVHSVASFFVSRMDRLVDARLDEIGTGDAAALRGTTALANARLAYRAYEEVFATPRWAGLADDGARPQRPLWASTGVKDPSYPDTRYVTELVAPGVVTTMPQATLSAVLDHGVVDGDTVTARYGEAERTLAALDDVGIPYPDVVAQLERDGVAAFQASWSQLLAEIDTALTQARR